MTTLVNKNFIEETNVDMENPSSPFAEEDDEVVIERHKCKEVEIKILEDYGTSHNPITISEDHINCNKPLCCSIYMNDFAISEEMMEEHAQTLELNLKKKKEHCLEISNKVQTSKEWCA